nr:hypothetical protein GCM10020185_27570 [Pseudomonas brassicacearum subsp. brassicacearum]
MLKRLVLAFAGVTLLLAGTVRAADTSLVLLTENFPPYNMAKNGKNFAQDENIHGIAVDIVREVFKRADISYSLTLRFPWERIYKLALENPGYGVFLSWRGCRSVKKLFKWVGPIGPDDWIMLAKADSKIALGSLEQARQYKVGAYKGDAIAETLTKQGLNPIVVLRDQDNAKKTGQRPDRSVGHRRSCRALPGASGGGDRSQDRAALQQCRVVPGLEQGRA